MFPYSNRMTPLHNTYSLLALYPGGIPRREPPSCEAPREPTIYVTDSPCEK